MTLQPTPDQPSHARAERTTPGSTDVARELVPIALRGTEASKTANALIGPRQSCIRVLLGQRVAYADFVTDHSEWGLWFDGGPLDQRPPEFWADHVHDYCHGGDE